MERVSLGFFGYRDVTTTAIRAWLLQEYGANDLGRFHVASHAYTSCTASSNSDHLRSPAQQKSPISLFFPVSLTGLWRAVTVWSWTIFSLEFLGFSCNGRRSACSPSLF